MIQEPIIAELALCIAELHDRVRRLQEENQDLVHQLGQSDTRINELLVANQRLKARLVTAKPYKDENARILSDKEALDELKRRMEADLDGATCIFHGVDTMTEPSPYEGTNSTDGVDTSPGQCAEAVPSINPNATTAD